MMVKLGGYVPSPLASGFSSARRGLLWLKEGLNLYFQKALGRDRTGIKAKRSKQASKGGGRKGSWTRQSNKLTTKHKVIFTHLLSSQAKMNESSAQIMLCAARDALRGPMFFLQLFLVLFVSQHLLLVVTFQSQVWLSP